MDTDGAGTERMPEEDPVYDYAVKSGYGHWVQPIVNTGGSSQMENHGTPQQGAKPASRRNGFADWLNPIVDANNLSESEKVQEVTMSDIDTATPQRGRGRPRVDKARDESRLEKRRAQVRNAQRTYQKRREKATASANSRCDELLQVLSDLSTDIEDLLKSAMDTGNLDQDDGLAPRLHKLWNSYDIAINSPSAGPELRLLRVKNEHRKAEYESKKSSGVELADSVPPRQNQPGPSNASDVNPAPVEMDRERATETTAFQPFYYAINQIQGLGGRNIFELVKERQAGLRESGRQT